jgi:hypothetical protein
MQLVSIKILTKYLKLSYDKKIITIATVCFLANVIQYSQEHFTPINQILPISISTGIFSYGILYYWVYLAGALLAHQQIQINKKLAFVLITVIETTVWICSNVSALGIDFEFFNWRFLSPLAAILVFCLFQNSTIRYSKSVNVLGGCTYGVYLIHTIPWSPVQLYLINDNAPFISWSSAIPFSAVWEPLLLTFLLFFGCFFIEWGRQKLFLWIRARIHPRLKYIFS